MDRDSRKLLARAKAYRLEGYGLTAIARRLGVSKNVISGLFYRDRKGLAVGRPTLQREPRPIAERFAYSVPTPRANDCMKHLLMIADAHGHGFPVLNLQPTYRVAA